MLFRSVSMHCWQGDDVSGFENPEGSLTGGIQATGNYPGKARNASELRADLEQAMRLSPGPKRLNLHAIYLESDTPVSRDQIKPEHFKNWVEWAKANQLGLDFNPSCFSHPLSADGFTLSHADDNIRQFWIDHCKASRRVSAYFGEQLGTPSVMNIWIPDGMKDITVDRLAPRQRLLALGLVDSGRGSGGGRALVAETAREEKAGSSGVKPLPWVRRSRRIRHPVHHA